MCLVEDVACCINGHAQPALLSWVVTPFCSLFEMGGL